MRRIDTRWTGRAQRWRLLTRPACLLTVVLLVLSCGGARLESKALDRPITVDGKAEDWRDSLTYFKDAGIAVGGRGMGRGSAGSASSDAETGSSLPRIPKPMQFTLKLRLAP